MKHTIFLAILFITSDLYCQDNTPQCNFESSHGFERSSVTHIVDSLRNYYANHPYCEIKKTYFEQDVIEGETYYYKNEQTGISAMYYPNGELSYFSCNFNEKHSELSLFWYQEGNIMVLGYSDTEIIDSVCQFDTLNLKEDDCITISTQMINPPYDFYDRTICFQNRFKHGKWMKYYTNGNLESESYFQHGCKINTWKYYDEKGDLLKQETYGNSNSQ